MHDRPDALCTHLNALGFDATCGGSSLFVTPPANGEVSNTLRADQVMARSLYLPTYPGVTRGEIARLAAGIVSFNRATADVRRPAAPRHV